MTSKIFRVRGDVAFRKSPDGLTARRPSAAPAIRNKPHPHLRPGAASRASTAENPRRPDAAISKLRQAVSVELYIHGAGGMLAVRLHVIDVEPKLLHAPQGLDPTRVFAHAAGHDAVIAHQRRDVGEVRRSPAQARAHAATDPRALRRAPRLSSSCRYPGAKRKRLRYATR